MTDETQDDPGAGRSEELLSRLGVIEDQPLESRAAAFLQLHDELKAALERSDASRLQS